MPKGPKGEKRPADVVGAADDEGSPFANLRLVLASRWSKSSHQRRLIEVCFGPQADLATVSDEAKRRVKYPEPTGGIVEDPNRPGIFLWSYEMRGPLGPPVHSISGEAPSGRLASEAMSAAHAEARRRWREYVISKGLLPEDD